MADASALLEVLLQTTAAKRVSARIFAAGETVCAPHLLDVEVAQVLRRYVRSGAVGVERAAEAIRDLADFPLHRFAHDVLLPRIWELRENLTAYDAAYVALAEALDAPLVTRDKALATVQTRAVIEIV